MARSENKTAGGSYVHEAEPADEITLIEFFTSQGFKTKPSVKSLKPHYPNITASARDVAWVDYVTQKGNQ